MNDLLRTFAACAVLAVVAAGTSPAEAVVNGPEAAATHLLTPSTADDRTTGENGD